MVALDKGTYLESEGTGRLHDVVSAPGVSVIDLLVDVQLDHEADTDAELGAAVCAQVGEEVEVGAAVDSQVDHDGCPDSEL